MFQKLIQRYLKLNSLIKESSDYELNIYKNVTVGDGIQSNNPWLQEMPDPISKVCWDNYISINPKDASELKIRNGFWTNDHTYF